MVGSLQIKAEIGSKIRISNNVFLQFALLSGIELCIIRRRDLAEQLIDQRAVFFLEYSPKKSHISIHQLRRHDHIIVIRIIRVWIYAELVFICSELCPPQCSVQTSHLAFYLVNAGLQFGKEIVLKLLQCAFSRRFNLFAILGKFTFFQYLLLCLKFLIVHHFGLEGTGFKGLYIVSPSLKECRFCCFTRFYALCKAISKIFADGIRAPQAGELLLIARYSYALLIIDGERLIYAVLNSGKLLAAIRQGLIFKLVNALNQFAFMGAFVNFLLVECLDFFL